MSGPRGEKCSTCYFWEKGELKLYAEEDREGDCLRNAPPTIPVHGLEILKHLTMISWQSADGTQQEKEFNSWEESGDEPCFWPRTYARSWCGEWRRKMKKSRKMSTAPAKDPKPTSRKGPIAAKIASSRESEARKKRLKDQPV